MYIYLGVNSVVEEVNQVKELLKKDQEILQIQNQKSEDNSCNILLL